MDKKKIFIIVGIIVAVVVLVVIISKFSSGTNPGTETNTAKDTSLPVSIELGRGVENNELTDKTDIFLTTDNEIHAAVTIKNLPPESLVEYQWYSFRTGRNILRNVKVGTRSLPGSSPMSTSPGKPDIKEALVRGEKNIDWGPGEYAFRVEVNTIQTDPATGKVTKLPIQRYERKYSVVTPTELDKINARNGLKSFQLTSSVDIKGNPNAPITDTFTPKTENIYAVVKYDGVTRDIHFEAKWIYLPTGREVSYFDKYISGTGSVVFGINAQKHVWTPVKEWPTGEYQLEIYIDGDSFEDIHFNGSEFTVSKIIFKVEKPA